MIIREARRIVELHATLRRISASTTVKAAAWARERLARLDRGEDLTDADADAIAAAELETFPVGRVRSDDRDPEFANRLAKRAIPLGELLELEPPEPPQRYVPRRRLPIP